MANVNKVILIGNLTRDPEIRYTPKGTAVTDVGLAVNRVRTNDQGERIEDTTFVDVTLWGRQAEIAEKYLGKGRAVYIEGRLQMDTWEDKQTGQKRSRLKVVGENLQFLPDGRGSHQQGGGEGGHSQQRPQQSAPAPQSQQAPAPQSSPAPAPPAAAPADDGDDEIPF